MRQTQYESATNLNGIYTINQKKDTVSKVPSGIYDLVLDPDTQRLYFRSSTHNHDEIVNLPGTAFDTVVSELTSFLKPDTKKAFDEYGFLYKRSSLLYGPPGTGKTCIVNRITEEVLKNNGIVLFNPNPNYVEQAFKELDGLQPETLVMVIFEELDQLVYHYESELLSLLDGEIQKENIVYLATTNYIEKVPERLKRPGRFSSVIEVDFPGEDARRAFLSKKLNKKEDVESWVRKTEGLSIDEITECIKSVFCLGYSLDYIIERLDNLNSESEGVMHKLEHERMAMEAVDAMERDSIEREEVLAKSDVEIGPKVYKTEYKSF